MRPRALHAIPAILLVILGTLVGERCQAQVILNGSFEDDHWAPGWYMNVTPSSWQMLINDGYMHGVHTYPGWLGPTPYGTQFVELDGDSRLACNCSGHAIVRQTVSGFQSGKLYRLTFSIATERNWGVSSWIFAQVSWSGGSREAVFAAPPIISKAWDNWSTRTLDFVPTSDPVTFYFRHLEPPSFYDWSGVGLDNVSVNQLPCVTAPSDMAAWWPLDEAVPAVAREVIGSHNGTHHAPISFVPGYSIRAYDFGTGSGYVDAGTTVGNFGGDFSVDAWVKLHPGRVCTGAVVDKESGTPATTHMTGYKLFVNSANIPGAALGIGGAPVTIASSTALPANNTWHHLAFTADRYEGLGFMTYAMRLYVDGSLAASAVVVGGSSATVANTGEFRIGQNSANQAPCPFGGAIDEVELYGRQLSTPEVQQLAAAPKCKCRAEACPLVQFGQYDTDRQTQIRICNDGETADIPWSIQGLPAQGSQCPVNGTSIQFTPSSGVAHVASGECKRIDVAIHIPGGANNIGLTSSDAAACYRISTGTCGQAGTGYGRIIGPTIIDGIVQCVVSAGPCFLQLPGRVDNPLTFRIDNTSLTPADLSWFVRECPAPIDSLLGDSLVWALRLDGEEPGTPTTPATLHIGANSSAIISVNAQFVVPQALAATQLELVMGDIGDPNPHAAAAIGLLSDETCGAAWTGWAGLVPDGTPPSARTLGTMVFDALEHRLVLFGGNAGSPRNDVWTMDPGPLATWTALTPAGAPPTARQSHSAIYDGLRQRMLIFGGFDGTSSRNDVWALSLGAGAPTWTRLLPTGTPPPPRSGHTAIYDAGSDRMIVFGGYPRTNDVWALNLSGPPVWQQLTPTGTPPSARGGHAALYDPVGSRMIVFGGEDSGGDKNDLWVLSLGGSPAWTQIAPSGALPAPRRSLFAALDSAPRELTIFGGLSGGNLSSDVWTIPLADPGQWSLTTPADDAGPGGRQGSMGAMRDVDGFFYTFGGQTDSVSTNDVWALPIDRLCSVAEPTSGVNPTVNAGAVQVLAAPNPFQGTTNIQFTTVARERVSVSIFDVGGRSIRRIDGGERGPGVVSIPWDGRDEQGNRVSSGIYLVRLRIGEKTQMGRLVRLR